MKIVIPVAGVGSRLKPHTHTVPKPLIEVAGKPMLNYVIDEALKVNPSELIFIVGYKKDLIMNHINKHYPNIPTRFVEQTTRDGNGSAVALGIQHCTEDEELVVIFGDTLIDFDLKKALQKQKADALIFAMEVDEPQHYGVLEITSDLTIKGVEEKPQYPKSNLAVIGTYYFSSLQRVKSILESVMRQKITMNGEYNIAQVIQEYLKDPLTTMKASKVRKWFDCGRPEILLKSNEYFLAKKSNTKDVKILGDSIIIPPCYISKSAKISKSVIGPNVSISDKTHVNNSIIRNTLISQECVVDAGFLEDSIVGRDVAIKGNSTKIDIGEKSSVITK